MNIYRSLAVATTLLLAAPAFADPPDWAPAHGHRAKHRYVYYREREIYYAPDSRLWFWFDGGDWRFGASLPVRYQQYTTAGISIELGSDRPYTEHRYVTEHYGQGDRDQSDPRRRDVSEPSGHSQKGDGHSRKHGRDD